jgi:hypothetical protein
MAKVQFQVDGLDSNTASIFNDDVTFDGNVEVNSLSIGGVDIFTAIPPASFGAMNYAQTLGTRLTGVSTADSTLVSVSITTTGKPVQIIATGDVENNSAGSWTILQLYRGSTAIGSPIHTEGSAGSENSPYALNVIDTPSTGTYTYALKLNNSAGGTFNFGESAGPVITAVELTGAKGADGADGAGLDPLSLSGISASTTLSVGSVDQNFGYRVNTTPWAQGQYVTFSDQNSNLVYTGKLRFQAAGGFGTAFGLGVLDSVTGSSGTGTSSSWVMAFAAAPQGATGETGPAGPATVPQNEQSSAYTVASSDNGKFIDITTGGVTIATSTAMTAGQNFVIYNDSASNQTITQGDSVTLRQSGTANTGNRTLAQYGIATVLCVGSNTYVVAGTGLS